MKKIILSLICLSTAAPLFADGTNQFADEKSRVSYAIGMMLGQNFFKRNGLDTNAVDIDIAAQGMKAIQSGATPLLTDEEMQQTLKAFQKEFAAKQQAIACAGRHQKQGRRRCLPGGQCEKSRRANAARRFAIPGHHQWFRPNPHAE